MSVEMRKAVALLALTLALVAAGCGSHQRRAAAPAPQPAPQPEPTPGRQCSAATRTLGSVNVAYVGHAGSGTTAYASPGGRVVARFGPENVNGYPTFLGVVGERGGCGSAGWYHVQLPIRPNGATGWVRAADLDLQPVRARIEVDLSRRLLTLFRAGRRVFSATVAIGSAATPTPIGRYYVNQRLVPDDPGGPFGPGAIGISAFSPVLTGWAQGGPVAIHGTNEPWSIGHAVSNGCIRLPNPTLTRLFRVAVAGTPVVIHP
ncbi:MAG TPA: L,D-transpeptidase [Gaiellaceae bacterium]|nr:L,D-transpeptidase [Gaiellaceae bacterium]